MFLDDRPLQADHTDLKGLVRIGIDEALTGLEESLLNLDDEQLARFPTRGCNNISWIVMHTLQSFNQYAVVFQCGKSAVETTKFWVINTPPDMDEDNPYPGRQEIFETLVPIRNAAEAALESASEEELKGKRCAPEEWNGNAVDAYVRAIFHANAHLRQIWSLRGAMGLTCKDTMPHQLWF